MKNWSDGVMGLEFSNFEFRFSNRKNNHGFHGWDRMEKASRKGREGREERPRMLQDLKFEISYLKSELTTDFTDGKWWSDGAVEWRSDGMEFSNFEFRFSNGTDAES